MKVILDIDGTLADVEHREKFAEEENWDKFFDPDLVLEDPPIAGTKAGLRVTFSLADEVYFLTGRPEKLRDTTVEWLDKHYNIRPDEDLLFMREDDDERPSVDVKHEIIEKHFSDEENLIFIEDEEDNLEMMEGYGEVIKAPDIWSDMDNAD